MLSSMTAEAFVRYMSWGIFCLIFLVTSAQALRRPRRATIDPALFFGASAVVIVIGVGQDVGLLPRNVPLTVVVATALLSLPYLLFRLIDDVVGVSPAFHRVVACGLILAVATVWAIPQGRPAWLDGLLLLGMVIVLTYVVAVAARASQRFRGVTQRRLAAVSAGSLFLVLNFVAGNLPRWTPMDPADARSLANLAGLVVGLSYYIGFAPPRWLRRTWQEPELRAFLERAAQLPHLPSTAGIVEALEQGTAGSLGAPHARIALWVEEIGALRFGGAGPPFDVPPDSPLPAAVAFREQRPIFSANTRYDRAADPIFNLNRTASAVLAAPITAGERRLGALTVSAARAPLFAEDDLALVQLLADQAAVVLESRHLIDEAARVRAREEVTRLKEDFLSAAAHDLRTPLTTIVAQAQMIDRRLEQNPARPVERASIQRIVAESERLRAMVRDLLDAARADQGRLLGLRQPTNLTGVAEDVARRHNSPRHPCTVGAPGPIVGVYDAARIAQLLENLVENAVKYSPEGGAIVITLAQDAAGVQITVADQGIGIPPEDLPRLFDRFHRGGNVDDRRFPGMGLGLYICYAIVTQHGGSIAAESTPGAGTRFTITLPDTPLPQEALSVA